MTKINVLINSILNKRIVYARVSETVGEKNLFVN